MNNWTSNLANYLRLRFKDFAENRKSFEYEWERNKRAYEMISGDKVDPKLGVGNKNGDNDKEDWRSGSITDLTRIKTNAGKILVCDVLLASGTLPISFKENKITNSLVDQILEKAMITEPESESTPSSGVNLMTQLVKEQLIRGQADIALKRAVHDAAIYGCGISRIYTDEKETFNYVENQDGWTEVRGVQEQLSIRPVSVWDFFTDLENHDIQKNSGVFERRVMSYSDVCELFGEKDGFNIPDALHGLKRDEGVNSSTRENESPHFRQIHKRKKNLEVLEFFGRVPSNYLAESEHEENGKDIEIMAVIVEDTLVRFAVMEKGQVRPFVRIFWEDPIDDIRGHGIADACSAAQQSLDSILRLIEDNKKLTCNAQFAIKSIFFANKHEKKRFYPGKSFEIDASCDDVRKAIQPLVFPDVGKSGFDLVNWYKQSGNESSMIPEIAHGISPGSSTTAYEISIRNEKAGKYISDVVRGIDDHWLEPVGKFFYKWNMEDPSIPPDFKGTFSVQAMGFASYNDRVLRMNTLKEMLSMCLSNEYLAKMVDIPYILGEWIKSNDLDPDKILHNREIDGGGTEAVNMMAEKLSGLEQQIGMILEALPSLTGQSEMDTAEREAKIEKLRAEADKIRSQSEAIRKNEETKRAKLISEMDKQFNGGGLYE